MIMYLLMKRYNKLKENIRKKIKSKLRNVEQKKKLSECRFKKCF